MVLADVNKRVSERVDFELAHVLKDEDNLTVEAWNMIP